MYLATRSFRKAASVPSAAFLHTGKSSTEMPPTSEGCRDMVKTASQAFLSPFSPVFELELDSKKTSGAAAMERCRSEQAFGEDAATKPSLLQQVLQLCRCTSPVASQLLQQLQRLRAELAALASHHPQQQPAGFSLSETSIDVEAMARELLASGFLVQVRDGAQQERTKNPRSCLQNLRHRFIVCLGWRSNAELEPEYLPEPVVVEPRFREQFAIAHPTAEYEALLQGVPACFVGPVTNLEAIVKLLCEQMVVAFKKQGLPVPPWRSRQALLSKWSPAQLAELAAKIANVRRMSIDMHAGRTVSDTGGIVSHAHGRLYSDQRPAAAHAARVAVGSAPPGAGQASGQAVQEFTAAVAANNAGTPQQLTQQQILAMMSPELQQQWQQMHQQGPAATTAGNHSNAEIDLQRGQVVADKEAGVPEYLADSSGCATSSSTRVTVPILAVASTTTAQQKQGGPMPANGAALPSAMTCPMPVHAAAAITPPFSVTAAAASLAPNVVSPAAADVLALLEAADDDSSSVEGSTLKFTRKASAEWKHVRSNGKKMKGLLAAALKQGSRGSLHAAAVGDTQSSLCMASAAAGSGSSIAAAAVGMTGSTGEVYWDASTSNALIRRTHYRAGGEEPWRRITTVRWGAYAAVQNVQQQTPNPVVGR